MDPQLFLSPVLAVQAVTENPIEILTKFTGRNIFYAVLTLAVTWLLVRMSAAFLEALSRQAPRARFFFKLLNPALRFSLWLAATVVVLSIFSPSRDTLLAVLASVGIALGLGSQDLVKNIIGGLVILTDRPYQLGDRVKIGDRPQGSDQAVAEPDQGPPEHGSHSGSGAVAQ